jgi:glycosyltransferase involved in cell wall biosynthesis
MNPNPFFSVCIPTYNRAAFLPACIESILNQSFADFEIIISDNQSTDDTIQVISRYKDDRIRLVQQSVNQGLWGNHNACIKIAEASWVVFLHSDDYLAPQALADLYSQINNANAETYPGVFIFSGDHSSVQDLRNVTGLEGRLELPASLLAAIGGIGNPSGMCFNKSVLVEIGGFNTDPDIYFMADHYLLAAIAIKEYDIYLIDKSHLQTNKGSHQASNNIDKLNIYKSIVSFTKKVYDSGRLDQTFEFFMTNANSFSNAKKIKWLFALSTLPHKQYAVRLSKLLLSDVTIIFNRVFLYSIGNIYTGNGFYRTIARIVK